MRTLHRFLVGVTSATLVLGMAGCGDSGRASDRTVSPGEPDDGAYFFARVRYVADVIDPDVFGTPRTLHDALPCFQGKTRDVIPTSVAAEATIVNVEPGSGIIWNEDAAGSDDPVTLTEFDDPEADERDVVLTLDVARSMTAPGVDVSRGTIKARMGVLAGADPEQFRASLASIGEAFVLLSTTPDGAHQGDFYPSLGGAGIIPIQPDGDLSLIGFGDEGGRFAGSLTAVDAAFNACDAVS